MFPLTIRMEILALFVVFFASVAHGQDRKIFSELNPNCTHCTKEDTLIYIKAVGSKDTVHQLWDFTQGTPAVIFAIGDVNSSIGIDWRHSKPDVFYLKGVSYSFAAAIDKLFEFDDLKDNGYIQPGYPQRSYSLSDLVWRRNETVLNESEAMLKIRGHFMDRRGSVEFKLDLLPYKDYAKELPHLIHTANSTLIDVTLVNLTTTKSYNSSRYALHLVFVSTDDRSSTMHYDMRKSLDDEHTPGVFEIVEIQTPESLSNKNGGFIQFRPVGYSQPERGVTTSTNAHVSSFTNTTLPRRSNLYKFYDSYDSNELLVQDMFISFGDSGDGFYRQHNYTAWSFTIGYGTPPVENFSFFVVMVMSIGLGVPIILALSGAIYVLLRRYKQRNTRTRFTDDE